MKFFYPFLLSLLFSAPLIAQHNYSFDTYNPDDNKIEELFDTVRLISGFTYRLEVAGTYSIWAPSYWSNPCGKIETAPMIPSPLGFKTGNVGFDMEYEFSYPTSSHCNNNPVFPNPTPRIEITLDSGESWFHPTTISTYDSLHEYQYLITGLGFPFGVRHMSDLNSDDYGILEFSFTPLSKTDIDENQLSFALDIYPNPARDMLFMKHNGNTIEQIQIINMMGETVWTTGLFLPGTSLQINVSDFAQGLYFVRGEYAGKWFSRSVVID
jgi:hypothetical protein